jgi:hypothetical protein
MLRCYWLSSLSCVTTVPRATKYADNPSSLQDLNECVSEVMRFMLASNTKKPNIPVTYAQLAGRLKELQSRKKAIANVVIQHAQRKFTAFGWEMAQLGSGARTIIWSIYPLYLPACLSDC